MVRSKEMSEGTEAVPAMESNTNPATEKKSYVRKNLLVTLALLPSSCEPYEANDGKTRYRIKARVEEQVADGDDVWTNTQVLKTTSDCPLVPGKLQLVKALLDADVQIVSPKGKPAFAGEKTVKIANIVSIVKAFV